MAIAKINTDDLIIFEGTSSKTGKPYSFAKLDRRLSNSKTFISQLKEAGVRVNGSKEADAQVEIEK